MIDTCIYCHLPIYGTYYKDWSGRCACENHLRHNPYCASCRRLSVFPRKFDDNYYVCGECIANAPNDKEFDCLVAVVRELLYNVGVRDIQYDNITFKLIEYSEMEAKGHKATGLHCGSSESNDRGRFNFNTTIYVLNHLNIINTMATLAHEILHEWQLENNMDEFNNYGENEDCHKLCEGFANMGAYLIYSTIGDPRTFAPIKKYLERNGLSSKICFLNIEKYCNRMIEELFESEDSIYGLPYRKILLRFKEIGWYGIIKEARRHKLKI